MPGLSIGFGPRVGDRLERHRPEQSGLEQRRVFLERVPGRRGQPLLRRERLVADQAIGPEVRHGDLQLVVPGLDRASNIHPPRRAPDYAQILPVETDLSEVLHSAEVEGKTFRRRVSAAGATLGVWRWAIPAERLSISRGAGVKFDAVFWALAPIFKGLEGDSLWPAPSRVECDFPRTGQFRQGARLRKILAGAS